MIRAAIAWMVIISASFYVGVWAVQPVPSNLSASYPSHSCGDNLPPLPPRPDKFKTETELATYNAEVDEYNQAIEQVVNCIQAYLDNAAADMERINMLSKEALLFLTAPEQ